MTEWFLHLHMKKSVVWADQPHYDWGRGPFETTAYLCLWTRWSWLHPGCRRQPELFSVTWDERPGVL